MKIRKPKPGFDLVIVLSHHGAIHHHLAGTFKSEAEALDAAGGYGTEAVVAVAGEAVARLPAPVARAHYPALPEVEPPRDPPPPEPVDDAEPA